MPLGSLMMSGSLKQQIFRLLLLLVGGCAAAIILAQWYSTSRYAERQVNRDLSVAQRVLEQVFSNREQQLFSSVDVLVRDFGFRAAVASDDADTIRSALDNHAARIASDWMLVADLQGQPRASTLPLNQSSDLLPNTVLNEVRQYGGALTLLVHQQKIYQAILMLVEAPDPIAVALVAFEMDEALIQQVENITRLNVLLSTVSDQVPLVITSLDDNDAQLALNAVSDDSHTDTTRMYSSPHSFVAHRFEYLNSSEQQPVYITLAGRLRYWYGDFIVLMEETLAIALVSVIIALLLAYYFSNSLSRPLSILVSQARRLAAGDYSAEASIKAGFKEIVRLVAAFNTMQQGIQQREQKIQYQASHDALTGLLNRDQISHEIHHILQHSEPRILVVFKAFTFREVNTAFGLDSGDGCLRSLAQRLTQLGGPAARGSGSELIWIPENIPTEADLTELLQQLQTPHTLNGALIYLPLRAAVLSLPDDADSVDQVFTRLNVALDDAHDQNLPLSYYREGLEQARLRRLQLLMALEQVLKNDSHELALFYQPKLELQSGVVKGAEALIRWNSETLGFVPPDEFIPVAEKAGLIGDITRWVIARAIHDMQCWQQQGIQIKVAINLSVRDIIDESMLDDIHQMIAASGLATESIEFEITEGELMTEPEKAMTHLRRLRDWGHNLAIDDFGTGYSSLAYLKNLPVSALKIDKSFVLKLKDDSDDQRIVGSIIDLAKRFHISVVAEGIEDQQALEMLTQWHCEWAQGYHISRPMNVENFISWMNALEDGRWSDHP